MCFNFDESIFKQIFAVGEKQNWSLFVEFLILTGFYIFPKAHVLKVWVLGLGPGVGGVLWNL